jgi:hypothetical protein
MVRIKTVPSQHNLAQGANAKHRQTVALSGFIGVELGKV